MELQAISFSADERAQPSAIIDCAAVQLLFSAATTDDTGAARLRV
jgi:hypothetical protein